MAKTVYLKLIINGDDVEGDSQTTSFDRAGKIECNSFRFGASVALDPTGRAIAKHALDVVSVTKPIDRSTPRLVKALLGTEVVDLAEFRFFRPDSAGQGSEEQFFTVRLEQAHISLVNHVSEDELVAGPTAPSAAEEVHFTSGDVTWTHEPTGATHRYRARLR